MNSPFLTYGNLRLLNLPHAKAVYDEVLVEDCYRRERIPKGSVVLDVGGYYGEFGIWCAEHCHVIIYEPSLTCHIAECNAALNGMNRNHITVSNYAIGGREGQRAFHFIPEAPYKSRLDRANDAFTMPDELLSVWCSTLPVEIAKVQHLFGPRPIVVKLDCEGAEREIFDDESWLAEVHMVLLEFHHADGEFYRGILNRHGFKMETTDPNPLAHRALILATKK